MNHHALLLPVGTCAFLVHRRLPQVQRVIQQLGSRDPLSTPLLPVLHTSAPVVCNVDAPLASRRVHAHLGLDFLLRGIPPPGLVRHRTEQVVHEVRDVLWRNPRRTEPDEDFARKQILRLGLLQLFDVASICRVVLHQFIGERQLAPYRSAQVLVFRHPAVRHRIGELVRIAEHQVRADQFVEDVFRFLLQQFRHARPVQLATFVEDDVHGVDRAVSALRLGAGGDGAFAEDVRLGPCLVFPVAVLQSQQQPSVRILLKRLRVRFLVEVAVLCNEGVVVFVQLRLKHTHVFVRRLRVHGRDELLRVFPELRHCHDALQPLALQVSLDQPSVVVHKDLAVFNLERALLQCVGCRNGCLFLLDDSFVGRVGDDVLRERCQGRVQRLFEVAAVRLHACFVGAHLPVPGADAHLPQHHFRVRQKILVDLHRPDSALFVFIVSVPVGNHHRPGGIPLLDEPTAFSARVQPLELRILLLQEDDVRRDGSSRSLLEGIIGQPDGAEEVGLLGQVLPEAFRRGRVHGVMRRDERHDSTRARLVEGLGEEVVVNRLGQPATTALLILRIVDRVVPEGHVADSQVEEVVGQVRILESLHVHRSVRIEVLQQPTGELVEFYGSTLGPLRCALRLEPEEGAAAGRRFQHAPALEAQPFDGLPHCLDDRGGREVCVQRRMRRRRIFLVGHQGLDLLVPLIVCFLGVGFEDAAEPVLRDILQPARLFLGPPVNSVPVRVKCLPKGSPADVFRQDLALFLGGFPVPFGLQLLQDAQRPQVVFQLLLERPFAYLLFVGQAQIVGVAREWVCLQPPRGELRLCGS